MSRMAALILTLIASPAIAAGDPIAAYLEKTSVSPKCGAAAGSEIVVCGRRDADRYRVPLVEKTPGDPKAIDVPAERARLVAVESPCAQQGAWLIGCGMVGVKVSTKLGSGKVEYRPLAP